MKLSLVIPVYNEAEHLEDFFEKLKKKSIHPEVEYIIVDDHSSDDSWGVIQALSKKHNIVIYRQERNIGKGAALHKGIELATGDIIAIQDADFEYDPSDLGSLIRPIVLGEADVVYGSRFRKSSHQVHRTFHYLVNRILTLLSNLMSGLYLTDMETCYKVFRADIIKAIELESQRFGFEPEITAKISKLRIRVQEYPIAYYPRNYDEGKKINWKDGVAALWFVLKYNLRPLSKQTISKMPEKYISGGRQWL